MGALVGAFMPDDPSSFFVNDGNVEKYTNFVLFPAAISVRLGRPSAFERDFATYDSTFADPFTGTRYHLNLVIPYRVGSPFFLSRPVRNWLYWYSGRSCLLDYSLPIIVQVDTTTDSEAEFMSTPSDSDSDSSDESEDSDSVDDIRGGVDERPSGPLDWVIYTPSDINYGLRQQGTTARQLRRAHLRALRVAFFQEADDQEADN